MSQYLIIMSQCQKWVCRCGNLAGIEYGSGDSVGIDYGKGNPVGIKYGSLGSDGIEEAHLTRMASTAA
jgi:hypothetical protein